jgi:YVTN family beta-propeller protein
MSVITTVPVGDLAVGVDVTPDGAFVYVAAWTGSLVSVISTATNTVVASPMVGSSPNSARIFPNGTRAYVAINTGVSQIDVATHSVVGSPIAGLHGARSMDFTPDGTRAYLTGNTTVQAVNTATNSLTATIPLSPADHGTAMSVVIPPFDQPAGGDFDADRKSEIAVFRPSDGIWYLLHSSTNFTAFSGYPFGFSTDVPVPGDYDGD